VIASCRLGRVGRSSLVTCEQVRTVEGELAAEAESVIVARDYQSGRTRSLTPAEFEVFAV
jgi:acyl-CoA thioesterase FadM